MDARLDYLCWRKQCGRRFERNLRSSGRLDTSQISYRAIRRDVRNVVQSYIVGRLPECLHRHRQLCAARRRSNRCRVRLRPANVDRESELCGLSLIGVPDLL